MKVLLLGDSPLMTTGFGRVQREAVAAFLSRGWEVASVTALQTEEKPCDLPLKQYVPQPGDNMGLLTIEKAVLDFEPDVIFCTSEPGGIEAFTQFTPNTIPFVGYVVIEGEPISLRSWHEALATIDFFTCSEYGTKIAKRDLGRDVGYVYHGVDHAAFYPDIKKREQTRRMLGWANKFVVMTVAQNVRRKQHPRLFEAIKLLREQYKQDDVVLYDHTVPFMRHWLEGWHLPNLSDAMGLHDAIMFNPNLTGFGSAIPVGRVDGMPGLADLYRAADLFVLPSQVEGFCLPAAEAMASGLPVAVTKYAAGWEVVSPAGAGIPVADWELAKNNTKLANVNPAALAKLILDLKRDPKRLARMSVAGVERANDFQWSAFGDYAVDAIENAARKGPRNEGSSASHDGVEVQEDTHEGEVLRGTRHSAKAQAADPVPQA